VSQRNTRQTVHFAECFWLTLGKLAILPSANGPHSANRWRRLTQPLPSVNTRQSEAFAVCFYLPSVDTRQSGTFAVCVCLPSVNTRQMSFLPSVRFLSCVSTLTLGKWGCCRVSAFWHSAKDKTLGKSRFSVVRLEEIDCELLGTEHLETWVVRACAPSIPGRKPNIRVHPYPFLA
jgi:hypothetical protein